MHSQAPDATWSGEPVLVTGGSGVVGSAVVRHLVQAGAEVDAVARSPESADTLRLLGAHPVDGDILNHDSLVRACLGRRYVFHVAGVNELCPRDRDRMWRVNVDGTRNVVRAAVGAGVERMVVTSSVTAVGDPTGRRSHERDQPVGRFASWYAETKWAGEQVALAEGAACHLVVVNPASVQGPGRATGTGKLILDVINGRMKFLVDGRLSIVDIDDCAAGHLLAAQRGIPGNRYILSGFTLSIRQAVALLEDLLGITLGVHFVPAGLVATLGPMAAPLVRMRGGPNLCREAIRTLTGRHDYDGSLAERELGLAYRSPQETMRRFIAWADRSGFLEQAAPGA